MDIPQEKIETACQTDGTREALQYVWLQGKSLIASNGRIMAIIPVEGDYSEDVDGPIPPRAFEMARQIGGGYGSMHLGKDKVVIKNEGGDVVTVDRPQGVTPLPWDVIKCPDTSPVFEMGIDLTLLARLIEAMGCNQVRIKFYGRLQTVYVESRDGLHRGFIMPVDFGEPVMEAVPEAQPK